MGPLLVFWQTLRWPSIGVLPILVPGPGSLGGTILCRKNNKKLAFFNQCYFLSLLQTPNNRTKNLSDPSFDSVGVYRSHPKSLLADALPDVNRMSHSSCWYCTCLFLTMFLVPQHLTTVLAKCLARWKAKLVWRIHKAQFMTIISI